MWDKLALAFEGTSQVRDFKINMLVHQYKLFKRKDNETIDLKFSKFRTIINNLRSLEKPYALKGSTSKVFKVEESRGESSFQDCFDEDEFSFISRKIQSMWKYKLGSRWKSNSRKHNNKQRIRHKKTYVNYERSRLLKGQRPKFSRQRNPVENHHLKIVLMKMNSHSSQGRSNPCGSTREDQDGRAILGSTLINKGQNTSSVLSISYIHHNKDEVEIHRSSWIEQQKMRYLLNSKANNFLMCILTELEYEKVYRCKLSK
ncbi:hypothetical protein CR513_28308, partial [Mucuna pruriens]